MHACMHAYAPPATKEWSAFQAESAPCHPALLPAPCLCSPRSRYTHLSWALWEKEEGNVEEARRLFKAGTALNPRDAAILQVTHACLNIFACPACPPILRSVPALPPQ